MLWSTKPVTALAATLLLAACSSNDSGVDDAAVNADAAVLADAGTPTDGPLGGTDAAVFDPGPEPTSPMTPVFGELTIIQLDVTSPTLTLGESAIIVGPDGTIALLDVGGVRHDDDVRDAVMELNTVHLTPANGYPARTALQVEWMIITHFHGDHVGSFEDLMVTASSPLTITKGIVHRGFVDLGAAMNEGHYETFCTAMRGSLTSVDVPLCETSETPSCVFGNLTGAHAATGCPGLHVGDLDDPADDTAGAPTFLDLGGGARLTLVAANAHVSNGTSAVAAPAFGHSDGNQENARSLAGVISHGDFRYHFGGDMTGAGTTAAPDIESHLINVAGATFYGALGVDVAHVHHHVRRTSSNATLIDGLAPNDGKSRNAVGGISAGHANSPHLETLEAWAGNNRLRDGRIWVTRVATLGDTHARQVEADGNVIVQTIQAGLGYRVQAAGSALFSLPFESVR